MRCCLVTAAARATGLRFASSRDAAPAPGRSATPYARPDRDSDESIAAVASQMRGPSATDGAARRGRPAEPNRCLGRERGRRLRESERGIATRHRGVPRAHPASERKI